MNERMETIKALGTAGALAAGACLSFSLGGPLLAGGLTSLFSDVAANTLDKLNVKSLKSLITKVKPGDLNHDLEKMIIEAVKWAVKNIEVLYCDVEGMTKEMKKETVQQCKFIIFNVETSLYKKNVDTQEAIMIIDNIKDPLIKSEKPDISDPDGMVDGKVFMESFYRLIETQCPTINPEHPFPDFFRKHFEDNFQLCFCELLKKKENQPALIVYNRNVMNAVRRNVIENSHKLTAIESKLEEVLQRWDNHVTNNEPIPELSAGLDNVLQSLGSKVDLLVDQNGNILRKLESIEQELGENTRIIQDIRKKMDRVKVKIQPIDSKTLKADVSDEIYQVANDYQELKAFLAERECTFFHLGCSNYAIEELNDESFGYLTGKYDFNQILARTIIETLKEHCIPAGKFCAMVQSVPQWDTQARIIDKAREIVSYSFVGVIGKEISKLMAIGKEESSDNKLRKFTEKSLQIVKLTLDLMAFALISQLRDDKFAGRITLDNNEKEVLASRLNQSFEPSVKEQLHLLQVLISLYKNHHASVAMPLPELAGIQESLKPQGELHKACMQLQEIADKKPDMIHCYEAEVNLATFFRHFGFLTGYKMVSMKRISYRRTRNDDPRFLHSYVALGIDNKANTDTEKINYTKDPVFTDSVLLYKGDNYSQSINLFPFVIDYNALTFEQGSKLCFFHLQSMGSNCLEYLFLDDQKIIQLESKGISQQNRDMNELFTSTEDCKKLNIDCVVDTFKEIQTCITEQVLDFGDL